MNRNAFLNAADTVGGIRAGDGLRRTQAVPAARGNPLADPADLVARALAILDEDKTRSDKARSRQGDNLAGEFAAPPVGLEPTPLANRQLQRRVLSDGTECSLPIR